MSNSYSTSTIAWLSDLHIAPEGEFPDGNDTRAVFTAALVDALSFEPDLIVLGGDLCLHDADADIYRWIQNELERTVPKDVPIRIIPGNHDNAEMITAHCTPHNRVCVLPMRETLATPRGPLDLLYLDSGPGSISPDQLDWLAEQLQAGAVQAPETGGPDTPTPALPVLIFVHHPPCLSGLPHMDKKYALENMDVVQEIIAGCSRPVWTVSGHYHCSIQTPIANGLSLISPSLYLPIRPPGPKGGTGFFKDSTDPGWIMLRVDGDGIHAYPRYFSATSD